MLIIPTNCVYSQPENIQISPQEIEKTLKSVKRESTTGTTFLMRKKVIETWCILLISSGREDEVRQIAPPQDISEIMRLKQDGNDKAAFTKLDHLYLKLETLGIPQIEKGVPDFSRQNNDLPPLNKSLSDRKYNVADQKKPPITANISVDYTNTLGIFSADIFGAISGPYIDASSLGLTQEAGFRVVTIPVPPERPSLDAKTPSQDDFVFLDRQTEEILRIGAKPMLAFMEQHKPSDLKKYALYVQNIAKHLTQGWNNGYQWPIRLFRFANEPDNPHFWEGTQQDFFETYAVWANALKNINPAFILVAPELMQVRSSVDSTSLNMWAINFLKYCGAHAVPIDYFSFHAYSPLPYYLFYENSKLLMSELKKYPKLSPLYGVPRLANDEWQIRLGDLWSGAYGKQFDTAWVAAHNINVLVNMIEQGVQLSVPMTGTYNGREKGCHDFLLVDCHGLGKPSFYAFKGFNWLYGTNRLATSGTDHMNFAAIAGKNAIEIIIVFANYDIYGYLTQYESPHTPYGWDEYKIYRSKHDTPNIYDRFQITINNLPYYSSQQIEYNHYLIDNTHNLVKIESKSVSGNNKLLFHGNMDAPSVHVVKIYKK